MALSSLNGNLKNLKHHERYYFPGGDLIIIIDDTAFCLASYFFTRESSSFRERLETNTNTDKTEALRAKQTIVIQPSERVTPEDFEKFCWVFYNESFGIYDAPLETWKVILRLATQYKFPEVRNLAFRELDAPGKFDLPLVGRIVLYRQYNADAKYLEPLYADLLSRPEPLTFEEGNSLGMMSTLSISNARERLRAASDKLPLPAPLPDCMRNIVIEMVRFIFWNGPTPDLGRLGGASANASGPSSSTNLNKRGSNSTSNNNGCPKVSNPGQKV